MFQDAGLKDKVAIVTGGAKGIGRAITNRLAEQGADVIFFYHSSGDAAREVEKAADAKGWKVKGIQCDVRDKTACDALIDQISRDKPSIDVLVNNSGIVRDNLLVMLSEEDVSEVFNTNVTGAFNVTRAVVPTLMRQRAGKIINISSVSGDKGGRGQANYAASKGAINAMTRSLAVELAKRNINVNAVAPGVIETDMSKQVRDLGGDQVLAKILLKRYGQPEEVANMVAFLASKYADYITGQVIAVDGGFKLD